MLNGTHNIGVAALVALTACSGERFDVSSSVEQRSTGNGSSSQTNLSETMQEPLPPERLPDVPPPGMPPPGMPSTGAPASPAATTVVPASAPSVPVEDSEQPPANLLDAGSASGGPALMDAAAQEPVSSCEQGDYLLCEDFEGSDLEAYEPKFEGIVELSSFAHSGGSSLRAETTDFGGGAAIAATIPTVENGSTLHFRAYYYLPEPLDHVNLASFENCVVVGQVNTGIWCDPPGRFSGEKVALPTERWFCLQFELPLRPDATPKLSLDGEPIAIMPNVDTTVADGLSWLAVPAWYTDDSQPPVEIFVDDLAVSLDPVPCL